MKRAEQVSEPCADHGEGAFWDDLRGRLLILDMLAGCVVDLTDLHAPLRRPVGKVVACVRRRERGGFVLALERGFAFADEDVSDVEVIAQVVDDERLRLNEGGCDRAGRFYCGSMAYAETAEAGTLYRLNPDLSIEVVLERVSISNGLQWSPGGSRAFYVDTPSRRVDVFDVEARDGSFHHRRPFALLPDRMAGSPDGLAMDEEEGLWVALWGGGGVVRFGRNGALTEVVPVPATNVTSCAFGDADLRTLYITTSRQGPGAQESAAGAVFAVDAGVAGAPVARFAG